MKLFAIKLRMFPPRQVIDDWMTDDPVNWEWDYPEYLDKIDTVYARPIKDEDSRPGLSVKLSVISVEGAPENPADWDWEHVTSLNNSQIEFIRAELRAEQPDDKATRCLECETIILDKPWTDGDGDPYCSSECIDALVGEGSYRVTPDGTVIKEET